MRTTRIVLLGGFALSASACALIWNFKDFSDGSADASADAPALPDAPARMVDADAGPLVDATIDSRDARDSDAGTGEASDASGAGEASDASEDGDASEASNVVCAGNYHYCANVGLCTSDFSPNSCGPTSCVACVVPVNGTQVICNGTACVGFCAPSLTLCDGGAPTGQCVDVTSDPDHCGSCGTVCPRPASGGRATCSGTPPACGIMCDADAGLTPCPAGRPTACVNTATDNRNCGACSHICRDGGPAAICVGGGCL